MDFIIKTFAELTTVELYEILRTREAVFIVEQFCPYPEADGHDYDSVHIFSKDESGRVIAYLRLFPKEGEPDTVRIGRLVTAIRNKGYGRAVFEEGMRYAFEVMNAKQIYLEAQVYAIGFYEKFGFKVCSHEFLEDGIPHVQMRK